MRCVFLLIVAAILCPGCSSDAPPPVPVIRESAAPARADASAPLGPVAPAAAHGTSPAVAPPPGLPPLVGTVIETLDSGGYTYLLVRSEGTEVWAAVRRAQVRKGAAVRIEPAMVMEKFQSPTLHRTFDHIVFGALAGAAPGAGAASTPPAPAGVAPDAADLAAIRAAHGAARPTAPLGDVKIARAVGNEGRTIAELFAQRAALQDKQVSVRGKVVKFLPGIMGRQWIHLRDGSGSPASQDDDLTITTTQSASVGDVILARGVLKSDRDFGAGYRYPVVIEDATLSK
jgi:hypothetical protein